MPKHPNQIRRDREKQPSFNVNLVEEDIRLIYNAVDFYHKYRPKSSERHEYQKEPIRHLESMMRAMMTIMMESSFQKNK